MKKWYGLIVALAFLITGMEGASVSLAFSSNHAAYLTRTLKTDDGKVTTCTISNGEIHLTDEGGRHCIGHFSQDEGLFRQQIIDAQNEILYRAPDAGRTLSESTIEAGIGDSQPVLLFQSNRSIRVGTASNGLIALAEKECTRIRDGH